MPVRTILRSLPGRPARLLAGLHFIDSFGNGLLMSGAALYLLQVAGLRPVQIGIGLSVAAVAGLVSSVVLGILSDRVGARGLLAWLLIGLGASYALYPLIHSAWTFYLVSVLIGTLQFGCGPCFVSLIAESLPEEHRVTGRAAIRSCGNAALGLGSLVAAVFISTHSRGLLELFPWINAVSFTVAGLLVWGLPRQDARPNATGTERFKALRDLPFVRVIAVTAVLAVHDTALAIGIPLWVIVGTRLPRTAIPLLIAFNTVLVVVLQVRVAKGIDGMANSVRAARWSGAAGVAACLLLAFTQDRNAWVAGVLVTAALVLLTGAELWQNSSAFALGFALAPQDRRGEYLGAFQLYQGVQSMVGPAVVAALIGGGSGAGWLGVAVLFCLGALLVGPVVGGVRERETVAC